MPKSGSSHKDFTPLLPTSRPPAGTECWLLGEEVRGPGTCGCSPCSEPSGGRGGEKSREDTYKGKQKRASSRSQGRCSPMNNAATVLLQNSSGTSLGQQDMEGRKGKGKQNRRSAMVSAQHCTCPISFIFTIWEGKEHYPHLVALEPEAQN